jgi:hypothetical protein
MSITFYYFGLRFSKPEQAVICLHSHPIRPGPDSHFLGLKRLGFGQRLHVKSHEERPLWPLLSRKFHTFDQCPIAKAMSSLRQVGTAALSRPRCLRELRTGASSLARAGCSDATPVASMYEGFQIAGSVCPSTLLAQVRYLVPDLYPLAFNFDNYAQSSAKASTLRRDLRHQVTWDDCHLP